MSIKDINLNDLRLSYLRNALERKGDIPLGEFDVDFLMQDCRATRDMVLAAKQ